MLRDAVTQKVPISLLDKMRRVIDNIMMSDPVPEGLASKAGGNPYNA